MSSPATAFLHYSAPPTTGGVEAVMAAHARVFLRHGYPVTVIAGTGEPEALPAGAELVLLPELSSQHPDILALSAELEAGSLPAGFECWVERLANLLRPVVRRADNLIVHNVFSKHFNLPLTAALFRLLEEGSIRNCLAWCHDLSWSSPGSRHKVHPGFPWDLLRTCRADVRYVAVSEERRQEVLETLQCPAEQVRVIYNGVDAAELLGLGEKCARLLEGAEWRDSDLFLLMPVRITRAKNIEFAMQVVDALRQRGRRAAALVTGPADPHSAEGGAYFDSLLELRGRMALEEIFTFAARGADGQAAELSAKEVGQLYRACDLVFLPSHREGFGMPVLEAGLAGVPVLASDQVPAARELGAAAVLRYPGGASADEVAGLIIEQMESLPQTAFKRQVRQSLTWEALFESDIEPLLQVG